LSARPLGISAAAIEAWRAGDRAELHRTLQLRPWHPSPLTVTAHCPYPPASPTAASWPRVLDLRRELIERAVKPGRRERPNATRSGHTPFSGS
jgi:hypothetical protein